MRSSNWLTSSVFGSPRLCRRLDSVSRRMINVVWATLPTFPSPYDHFDTKSHIMLGPTFKQAIARTGTSSSQRIATTAAVGSAAVLPKASASSPLPSTTRGYASPSSPNQMATPVDVQPGVRAGRGSTQRKSQSSNSHRGEQSQIQSVLL